MPGGRRAPQHTESRKRAANRARTCATVVHQQIRIVLETGKPADRILAAFFRQNRKFGSTDRRLISTLYFAVFRWWGWLQHIVPDPTRPIDPHTTTGLAVLYGACLLDDVPASSILPIWRDELKHDYDLPKETPQRTDCLVQSAKSLSRFFRMVPDSLQPRSLLPEWIWDNLPANCDHDRLLAICQQRPPLWLRAQGGSREALVTDLKAHGFKPQISETVDAALALRDARPNLYELSEFTDGRFEVQDLASQVIGLVCAAEPKQRWWDACAGAGGKSLQLASMMANTGTVVATDIREYKLLALKKRSRRGRLHNIRTRAWKGRAIPVQAANFDGVLVDAPCTCSGVWRRSPDARWTTPPTEVQKISELQADILQRAAAGVRPGGCLVYATCSLCTGENEAVIRQLLETNSAFTLDPTPHPLTGEATDGTIRVWPYDADCDGVFVARLRRTE